MSRWNEDETKLAIKLLQDKLSYDEIAVELNRTSGSVRLRLQKLGYKRSDETKITKKCLYCSTTFNSSIFNPKKFCSSSCSVSYNNKLRNRKLPNKCVICEKEITRKYKCCSNTCASILRHNNIFKLIENGDTTLYEGYYKKYLIHKYGNKCMECDWCKVHPITGKVPIQLEHIDGNSDNNNLTNLKLLCPNCHSLTPTYGALNKGKGRDSKRNQQRQNWRLKNVDIV
jgi:predicted nucleic acid-binding Zn ribbon protein